MALSFFTDSSWAYASDFTCSGDPSYGDPGSPTGNYFGFTQVPELSFSLPFFVAEGPPAPFFIIKPCCTVATLPDISNAPERCAPMGGAFNPSFYAAYRNIAEFELEKGDIVSFDMIGQYSGNFQQLDIILGTHSSSEFPIVPTTGIVPVVNNGIPPTKGNSIDLDFEMEYSVNRIYDYDK
eukprot:TRINITY_DN1261_c0_g1_i2.p1 TRINITY_DN1261_c0_g1~~TRINITY_DN1261_c0_g1_i2.p1  ORF type:complete len:181 (+),score=54.94 TRINITY_DN1261_c0_g1_i2:597-1139(+)